MWINIIKNKVHLEIEKKESNAHLSSIIISYFDLMFQLKALNV